MISAVSIIDPLLTERDRRVLSVLSLHARNDIPQGITQARVASMLGWFIMDKRAGVKVPKISAVSVVYKHLVKLGYLLNSGQSGWDMPLSLRLVTPAYDNGYIIRPDNEAHKSNFVRGAGGLIGPKLPREQYEAGQKAKGQAHANKRDEKLPTIPRYVSTAPDRRPAVPPVLKKAASEYSKMEVIQDLIWFHEGLDREIPDSVYFTHGVAIPDFIDPTIAETYRARYAGALPSDVIIDDLDLSDMSGY